MQDAKKYNGIAYQRVQLVLDTGNFVQTDIVPGFRNYGRWKSLYLDVGMIVEGLKYWVDKSGKTQTNKIDADSPVVISKDQSWPEPKMKPPKVDPQGRLF